MQAFISTSSWIRFLRSALASTILLVALISPTPSWSLDPTEFEEIPKGGDESKEHDFLGNAYTEFGEYQDKEEDAETLRFFKYGRFFGVSAGSGYHSVTGDRGSLWEGGFPSFTLRLHYWFDFNFALSLDFSSYAHFFTVDDVVTRVNGTHFGVYFRYLVEPRDLSAPLTFARPYFFLGGGIFNKTQVTLVAPPDSDKKFGFGLGAGFEFVVSPKRIYIDLEFKGDFVNFDDRSFPPEETGLESLNGIFYTLGAHLKFTY